MTQAGGDHEILRDAGVIRYSGAADRPRLIVSYGKSACTWIKDQLIDFRSGR